MTTPTFNRTRALELLNLDAKRTPTETATLIRYDHGGGRLFIPGNNGTRVSDGSHIKRTLIADFFNEGDREFYAAAPELAEQLRLAVSRIEKLEAVWKLADELCTSVDCAGEDIGGCRPAMTILQELGPAVDVARNRT